MTAIDRTRMRPPAARYPIRGERLTVAQIWNKYGQFVGLTRAAIHIRCKRGRTGDEIIATPNYRLSAFAPDSTHKLDGQFRRIKNASEARESSYAVLQEALLQDEDDS
jgi:hypothetical protein